MKKFIVTHPIWLVVIVICLFSVGITLAFVPIVIIIIHANYLEVAIPSAILAMLVALILGIPVVHLYRKTICENLEMIDKLGKDHLTGLLNRHTFIEKYLEKVSELHLKEEPIALVMVDIDHFKMINDTHGHLAGDFVIKTVSEQLSQFVSKNELICRFGGEEFLLVLWNLDYQSAINTGNKILEILRASVNYQGQTIPYTVSIGLVYCNQCEGSPDELIRQADNHMYLAKYRGRDQMVYN